MESLLSISGELLLDFFYIYLAIVSIVGFLALAYYRTGVAIFLSGMAIKKKQKKKL